MEVLKRNPDLVFQQVTRAVFKRDVTTLTEALSEQSPCFHKAFGRAC